MAFDYRDLLDTVKSTLGATATVSTLVASMTVDHIISSANIGDRVTISDPKERPRQVNEFPHIFIHLKGKTEEIAQLGTASATPTAKRNIVVNVDISGLVWSGVGSGDADKQSHIFARNVETILRNNFIKTGTGGWDWSLVPTAVFEPTELEGVYLSTFTFNTEFNKNAFS